ncbi:MAG: tetratricopeptide repeat protein, partial [Anaerolineae bacterium]|nr:tetratricopeptide repeat protein [Anaerolineae bacterium]
MPFSLQQWQDELKPNAELFAALLRDDKLIDLGNGITAAAILWSIRLPENRAVLGEVISDANQQEAISDVLNDWHADDFAPKQAARNLGRTAKEDETLRAALKVLIEYFLDALVQIGMLQPGQSQGIQTGDVTGGIVNIGGVRYFAGPLIINYIKPKAERICPKPPSMPREFGGRDRVLEELMQQIRDGERVAITAITGLGGVGKTMLAMALANRLYDEKVFRAVLWANVTRNPDAVSILSDWVVSYADSSFDVSTLRDPQQIAVAARTLLEDVIDEQCEDCDPPRVLVVLDDVWDNGVETARLLSNFACPENATVLITSRSSKVAIQLNAYDRQLDTMSPEEAADMLAQYLPGTDESARHALGKALGGHALALELAAQHVRVMQGQSGHTLSSALEAVTKKYKIGILAGEAFSKLELAEGETSEDNLEIALSYSYEDLAEDDRTRFRALGTLPFNEPFDLMMLAALWDGEPDEVEKHCVTLRLASLLDTTNESGWYQQQPLLRAYAYALLRDENEDADTFNRYADFMIAFAGLFRELPMEQWTTLNPYLPHLHFVGDKIVEVYNQSKNPQYGLKQRIFDLGWNVIPYFHYRQSALFVNDGELRHPQRIDWLLASLDACTDASRQITLLNNIGLIYSALGEKQVALNYHLQALPLTKRVNDPRSEAATFNNIGLVYDSLGYKQQALDYYEMALPLVKQVGDIQSEATILNNMAGIHRFMGNLTLALRHSEQALILRREMGDASGEAITLNNLGSIFF